MKKTTNKLNSAEQPEIVLLHSIYAQMALDKAVRDFQKEQIYKRIDLSLQQRNKEEFLRLTEELKIIS